MRPSDSRRSRSAGRPCPRATAHAAPCAINTSSATTSAGTRIPAPTSCGMRHKYAPTRSTFIELPPADVLRYLEHTERPQVAQKGPDARRRGANDADGPFQRPALLGEG